MHPTYDDPNVPYDSTLWSYDGEWLGTTGVDVIECWVTTLGGAYIAHLERSQASPFRRFGFVMERNAPGAGSLEYATPNALLAANPTLLDHGNLVWMRYRGRTVTWVIEQTSKGLAGEEANRITVSGRGVLQLLYDRIIWPDGFSEDDLDPSLWASGALLTTTLDQEADAGLNNIHVLDGHRLKPGQRISISNGATQEWLHLVSVDELVGNWWLQFDSLLANTYPVAGTVVQRFGPPVETTLRIAATAGDDFLEVEDGRRFQGTTRILIDLNGSGEYARMYDIIHHIAADTYTLLLQDPLVNSYALGASVSRPGDQWRTIVATPAGEMLWTLIEETNERFATQIVRGTIEKEADGSDDWTQRFRYDTLGDVVKDVAAVHGDVVMDGLTFHWYLTVGTDLSTTVIVEEGFDILRTERDQNDRDTVSWIVAEGVGEGVFAKLAIAEDTTVARRREAYMDAKDAGNLPLLQAKADAALAENGSRDAVGLELAETRWLALTHYQVGDWIRVIAPSRGIDDVLRIVSMTIAETDDKVTVSIDVNSRRTEALLDVENGARTSRRTLGVHSRQPQGQLVPFPIIGSGVFDSDPDVMEVYALIPDELFLIVRVTLKVVLRKFWATARSAASDGSSSATSASGGSSTPTSGSGGSSTPTSDGSPHEHKWGDWTSDTAGGYALRKFATGSFTPLPFDLATQIGSEDLWTFQESPAHTHDVSIAGHTHSVTIGSHSHTVDLPNHTHAIVYGTYAEALPASWSVVPKLYRLVSGVWVLIATYPAITDPDLTSEIDMTADLDQPGDWKITLRSSGGQPNGGRLAADVYGVLLAAIQSS